MKLKSKVYPKVERSLNLEETNKIIDFLINLAKERRIDLEEGYEEDSSEYYSGNFNDDVDFGIMLGDSYTASAAEDLLRDLGYEGK